MKSPALTILMSLSLITGFASISQADDMEVLRIPRGGGQYTEVRTSRPAKPTTALIVRGRAKVKAADPAVASKAKSKLHVITGNNAITGGPVALYAR